MNIVKTELFGQEALAVFLQSKWTLYGWWIMQGIIGGALGGIAFNPQLSSPWWILPAYFAGVFAIKRAFMILARRVFPGDSWWQATNVFLPAFLIACLPPAISALTSRTIVALPVVIVGSFAIGFLHTAFRTVFVRDQVAWVWAAAPLATAAAVTGWLLLPTAPLTLSNAIVIGAVVACLYILLTTILLELMWDATAALRQRGTLAVDKHEEFAEGLALHKRALDLEPDNPKLYAARADIYLKQGDIDRAKADIEQALALDARCPEARVLRANLMAEAGELDKAIAEYDQLVNYKWGFYPAYLNRARAYSLKGDYDRAFADYDRSAKLGDDAALSLANRADTYYRMGNYDQAITDCDQTISLSTLTPIAWVMALITRGKCHLAKGERELAARDFKEALNRTSNATLLNQAEEGLRALQIGAHDSSSPDPNHSDSRQNAS